MTRSSRPGHRSSELEGIPSVGDRRDPFHSRGRGADPTGATMFKTMTWTVPHGRGKRLVPYVLVAPAMLFLLATLVYPLCFSLLVAFRRFTFDAGLDLGAMPFVGLRNFERVLADPPFQSAVTTTAAITVAAYAIELIFGFALALAVDRVARNWLGRLYSTALMVPLMIPTIAAALVWRMLLNPQYGAVNGFFTDLGGTSIDFLGDPTLARWSIIVVDVWQWTPFVFLLLLAGLRSLPEEPFEAALVDGASRAQAFRYLTLPLMAWPLLLVTLLRGADLVRTFDYVYGLTFGGPGYATETVAFYTFRRGFQDFELGVGAAASWLIFVAVYGGTLLVLRLRIAREHWS